MLNRRAALGLLGCFLSVSAGRAGPHPRLTTRQVTRLIFEAPAGQKVDLSHHDLRGLDLSGLDLRNADLSYSNLFGVDLTGANLEGTNLTGALLDRTVLIRANLSNASMSNTSVRRPAIYTDMRFDPHDVPDLRRVDLRGARVVARLNGADFSDANLSDADFSSDQRLGAGPSLGLSTCNFNGAIMNRVVLWEMDLTHSSFVRAQLRGADLSRADLSKADLTGADLTGANLSGATLKDAILGGVIGLRAEFADR